MRVLVLDTSTPAVSAGVVEWGAAASWVLAERVVVDGRRHGELLARGVRSVLQEAGPVEAVVVGVGPGPFTGLRVGIVTAAALADALGVPALGVCSLDGMAAPDTGVVTDARRREVYWARYDASGARVAGPQVDAPVVAAAALGGARRVVGDGALLHADVFASLPVEGEPRYPVVRKLAEVAVRRHLAGEPALPLTPLYLRRPDAQEPQLPKRVTPAPQPVTPAPQPVTPAPQP